MTVPARIGDRLRLAAVAFLLVPVALFARLSDNGWLQEFVQRGWARVSERYDRTKT